MLTINKNAAVEKLNSLIQNGHVYAQRVIENVISNQPTDYITNANALHFAAHESTGANLTMMVKDKVFGLHRFALGQLAEVATVPTKFIDSLASNDWGRQLIAHNLNEIFSHRSSKRHLVRTINGEVRGFLSDQYRRLDSRQIVEAFATGVQKLGALPYKGYVTDTKVAIQAIMPDVYEPIPGELVAFVCSLENSDFGNGALSFRAGLLRIWCDNLAVTEETMRQIHLGRRLDENLLYSQRTYELDSRTTVSALSDIIQSQMNREGIQKRMELVEASARQEVDPAKAQKMLREAVGIGKAQEVIDAFKSADIEMMPAGNSTWRLSNAISWIAGKEEDAEKKLDLMKLAGTVLQKAA
jgi:hypothetical protein